MLSIFNLSSASSAEHYYSASDYYMKGNDAPIGEWFGKGAERLRLEGEILPSTFRRLLEGTLPGGQQLGRIAKGDIVHAPGVDLTFSAPKSVSIVAEVAGDDRIYDVQQQAVHTVLRYIESHLMATRAQRNGILSVESTDNITAALFRHSTSRNHDPQLHTHCVLLNMTQRTDDVWRSAFVGKLRSLLAETCVRMLEPDLVILDEFQRFKHLLSGEDDASVLETLEEAGDAAVETARDAVEGAGKELKKLFESE